MTATLLPASAVERRAGSVLPRQRRPSARRGVASTVRVIGPGASWDFATGSTPVGRHEADRRLQADDAGDARGRDHLRRVGRGLQADRQRRQARGGRGGAAGGRAGRRLVGVGRQQHLAAERRVALRHVRVEQAAELGHVRLAEDDRARRLELRHERGVGGRHRLLQRDRAARRRQPGRRRSSRRAAPGCRAAGRARRSSPRSRVERLRLGRPRRVFSDAHGLDRRALGVRQRDPRQVRLRQRLGASASPRPCRVLQRLRRLRLQRERQDRRRAADQRHRRRRSPGCSAPRAANGGAGIVFAQRYMLGFSARRGWRSFVPCSITYATPIRSRSLYALPWIETLSVRRWVAL